MAWFRNYLPRFSQRPGGGGGGRGLGVFCFAASPPRPLPWSVPRASVAVPGLGVSLGSHGDLGWEAVPLS